MKAILTKSQISSKGKGKREEKGNATLKKDKIFFKSMNSDKESDVFTTIMLRIQRSKKGDLLLLIRML